MKINKVISYILIAIAVLIFAFEIVATAINHIPGFWIHILIFVVILLYLVLSVIYLRKNDRILGILVLALFILFPFIQFLDPNYGASCSSTTQIKIINTYILFVIPLFIPGLILFLSSFGKKEKRQK